MKIPLILTKDFTFHPYDRDAYETVVSLKVGAIYESDVKNIDIRTLKQNSALHLWCTQIADVLNANNMYMTGLFSNDIIWTKDLVKIHIVRSLIEELFDIKSTTKLSRRQLDVLIDTIVYIFGEKKGIVIPDFPNKTLWDEINKNNAPDR